MKLIQYKMSMLLAGFLNGMNFFPIASSNPVSKFTGSLPAKFEISCNEGFADDADKLKNDWSIVKDDIRKSFDTVANESEQAKEV